MKESKLVLRRDHPDNSDVDILHTQLIFPGNTNSNPGISLKQEVDWNKVEEAKKKIYHTIHQNADGALEPKNIKLDLQTYGKDLYRELISSGCHGQLYDNQPSVLNLQVSENLGDIPWFLVCDPQSPVEWGRQYNLGLFSLLPRKSNAMGPDDVLIICDPTGTLENARKESMILSDLLKTTDISCYTIGLGATRDEVLKRMKQSRIVFFLGHGKYDAQHPSDLGWLLGNNELLRYTDLESLEGCAPQLIYANACWSAVGGSAVNRFPKMVDASLRAGVTYYIGAVSKLPDLPSFELSSTFLRGILAGQSFGLALRKAREADATAGNLSWCYMQGYGDANAGLRSRQESECWSIAESYRELVLQRTRQWRLLNIKRDLDMETLYISREVAREKGPSKTLEQTEDVVLNEISGCPGTKIVISASAGSGKSTLFRHWSRCLALRDNYIPLPVSLPLAVCRMPGISSEAPLSWSKLTGIPDIEQYSFLHSKFNQWINENIKRGKCILLLDGLDEVPQDSSVVVRKWIKDLAAVKPLIIIIFSRPTAVDRYNLAGFEEMGLCPFNTPAIESFIGKWFGKKNIYIDFLNEQRRCNDGVSYLLGKPLYLTYICYILEQKYTSEQLAVKGDEYQDAKKLFRQDRLIAHLARILLHELDHYKEVVLEHKFDILLCEHLLSKLGGLLLDQGRSTITYPELITLAKSLFPGHFEPDLTNFARGLIVEIVERSCLIQKCNSLGFNEPEYRFCHRLFLDYFAANQRQKILLQAMQKELSHD